MQVYREGLVEVDHLAEIKVQVVYFGKAREAAGTPTEVRSLSSPADVKQLLSVVMKAHPALAGIMEKVSVLVNGHWASEDMELGHGDRVAFVPPVGGG
jgi:molybdopterin converting factor small subunit